LTASEVRIALQKLGIETVVLASPDEVDACLRTDAERWADAVKDSGLKFG
jgi:hypothetical protein